MIDFHTHILPGIDDGSRNIEMTGEMLKKEASMGVNEIYATPHFYAYKTGVNGFLEKRRASYEKVKQLTAQNKGLPVVRVGAEVYYFRGMGKAEATPQLCIEGTDVLLLEMPFEQWTQNVYTDVAELVYRWKLKVVLAHVERYEGFQKDMSVWDNVMNLPVTIQMNAGSFLKFGLKRRFCMKLLSKEADRVIIGSDCHNMTDRAPNLAQAIDYIGKKAGLDVVGRMMEYEAELLGAKGSSRI